MQSSWEIFCLWIQRKFNGKNLLKKVAIHESAHIVFSYFYGFTVSNSKLSILEVGNGVTRTEYGQEKIAANIVFNHWTDAYSELTEPQQKHVIRVAIHLLVILYSGSTAEAVYYKSWFASRYKLKVSGEDLSRIKVIESFLAQIGGRIESEVTVRKVFWFFETYPIFKLAINRLSSEFLLTNDNSLNQEQIENVLSQINFYHEKDQMINVRQNQ